MTRIYDTFIFGGVYGELDMLECRLIELDKSPVYRHVIVEAPFDHQGNAKPLVYLDNQERFAPWKDRIIHVTAEIIGPNKRLNPWAREQTQRAFVYTGLKNADPDDIVWLCDVDEIPSRKMWTHEPDRMYAWNMRLCMFAVDWVVPEPTRIALSGRFRDLGNLGQQRDNASRAAQPLVEDAGWHFTWLGGPAGIERKAKSFCHLELKDMILLGNEWGYWYEQGFTWHGALGYPPTLTNLQKQEGVEMDETWPEYMRTRQCPPEWFRP